MKFNYQLYHKQVEQVGSSLTKSNPTSTSAIPKTFVKVNATTSTVSKPSTTSRNVAIVDASVTTTSDLAALSLDVPMLPRKVSTLMPSATVLTTQLTPLRTIITTAPSNPSNQRLRLENVQPEFCLTSSTANNRATFQPSGFSVQTTGHFSKLDSSYLFMTTVLRCRESAPSTKCCSTYKIVLDPLILA